MIFIFSSNKEISQNQKHPTFLDQPVVLHKEDLVFEILTH
jgi:hypothetical protein